MNIYQKNDISLESQWRAIILFGKNTASYKFAFAKSLLEISSNEKTFISLEELAEPFFQVVGSEGRTDKFYQKPVLYL